MLFDPVHSFSCVRDMMSTCILSCIVLVCFVCNLALAQNASLVHIGALVAYNTLIGRVAKQAILMAVDDINRNSSLFSNSKLVLHMMDSNCSAFMGAAEAMELMKQEVVAVIGPQSSAVSHFVAHMGGATQVPFISYAATDPSLSEFQYPYFFRIAHTDAVQMAAVASLIGFYGWREVVVLHTDDDFGANGAAALSDALIAVDARVVQKAALVPGINQTAIGSILTDLAAMQTRVFVVHMTQNTALSLFQEAKYLGMMSAGYVWIVTDSLLGTLGSTEVGVSVFNTLQGVVGTRGFYRDNSPQLRAFVSEWQNRSLAESQLHLYGLFAYDAIWFLAYALDSYLQSGLNITFRDAVFPANDAGNSSELAQLRIFEGGESLRTRILRTKFQGTSGFIQVNSKGDLIRTEFEIVNIVGQQLRVVGYWTNETQLSLSMPGSAADARIDSFVVTGTQPSPIPILWPGNGTETPRGWVLPRNGKPLKIAVPNKAGFRQFINLSSNSSNSFSGFCIDVFRGALNYLPYSVPYIFVPYGLNTTPVYDDMIEQLANKVYDAVVGDVTITTKRMEKVDFTQPYIESGLVVVVPAKGSHSNEWAFLRPFTASMWFVTLAFFIFTGLVIWMLEHKRNRDFRGNPKKQAITILWFTFSTLFFSHREKTKSTCGRFVIIIWLFVVLIITSSYTANLTSILTVQQLTPTIQGISSLQASDVPIGYQTGSFVKDYLISINIAKERLKAYPSMADYDKALTLGPSRGGVAAVVDEIPYVQVFLGGHCQYTIAGQEFTKGGWGFAFPKDSELAVDMSTAILTMSENGELQRIHDLWLPPTQCATPSSQVESNQLDLRSFWGLFLITGVASFVGLLVHIIRLLCRFWREGPGIDSTHSISSRSSQFLKSFASFLDESELHPSEQGHASKKEKVRKDKSADPHVCHGNGGDCGICLSKG